MKFGKLMEKHSMYRKSLSFDPIVVVYYLEKIPIMDLGKCSDKILQIGCDGK